MNTDKEKATKKITNSLTEIGFPQPDHIEKIDEAMYRIGWSITTLSINKALTKIHLLNPILDRCNGVRLFLPRLGILSFQLNLSKL